MVDGEWMPWCMTDTVEEDQIAFMLMPRDIKSISEDLEKLQRGKVCLYENSLSKWLSSQCDTPEQEHSQMLRQVQTVSLSANTNTESIIAFHRAHNLYGTEVTSMMLSVGMTYLTFVITAFR